MAPPCVGFAAFPPEGGQRQWPGEARSTAFPEWETSYLAGLAAGGLAIEDN
jgi:hypothetical protein